jgi:hypothetical protein
VGHCSTVIPLLQPHSSNTESSSFSRRQLVGRSTGAYQQIILSFPLILGLPGVPIKQAIIRDARLMRFLPWVKLAARALPVAVLPRRAGRGRKSPFRRYEMRQHEKLDYHCGTSLLHQVSGLTSSSIPRIPNTTEWETDRKVGIAHFCVFLGELCISPNQRANVPVLGCRSLELNAAIGDRLERRMRNDLPIVINLKDLVASVVCEFLVSRIVSLFLSTIFYKFDLPGKVDAAVTTGATFSSISSSLMIAWSIFCSTRPK